MIGFVLNLIISLKIAIIINKDKIYIQKMLLIKLL